MSTVIKMQAVRSAVYDPVARATHWLTVLLVAAEYLVGSIMPGIHHGTPLGTMIRIHLALGSGILLLVLFRIFWRLTHRPPPPPSELPLWQERLSRITHLALYAMLILMPVTGWASASARGWPVRAFGLIPVPALLAKGTRIGFRLGGVHADIVYWILLALIAMHVAAALYHRLVRRDSVLSRMLPGV